MAEPVYINRKAPLAVRFWRRVAKSEDPADCWNWIGAAHKEGYAYIWDNEARKRQRINRATWLLIFGPIPDGFEVCHHCDNTLCCNPAHLFLGTHTDNMHDMRDKDRAACKQGTRNGRAKLTEADIPAIRLDPRPSILIAAHYGVSRTAIDYIKKHRNWSHVL